MNGACCAAATRPSGRSAWSIIPPPLTHQVAQSHWGGRSVSSYLFVSSRGNRLGDKQIYRDFYALSRWIGLRGEHDSHGPRLHDFRHRFATATLLNWYRCEKEPERLLPVLSTYMGHVNIADTQW